MTQNRFAFTKVRKLGNGFLPLGYDGMHPSGEPRKSPTPGPISITTHLAVGESAPDGRNRRSLSARPAACGLREPYEL